MNVTASISSNPSAKTVITCDMFTSYKLILNTLSSLGFGKQELLIVCKIN
jgi:hypothetical protein